MSIMNTVTLACPSCGADVTLTAVESVNADRRPDLREAIIDGTFQAHQCGNCNAEFMLDPEFNYLDMGRGQWLSVQPFERLAEWVDVEDEALSAFDLAYGAEASTEARDIGDTLSPRLVFGWTALREKLLIGDFDLDDVTVELTKLALIRGLPGAPIEPGVELRLIDVEDNGDMVFQWTNVIDAENLETLIAPRSLYDSITEAPDAWADLRASLLNSPFVDIQKLFIGEGRAAS